MNGDLDGNAVRPERARAISAHNTDKKTHIAHFLIVLKWQVGPAQQFRSQNTSDSERNIPLSLLAQQ